MTLENLTEIFKNKIFRIPDYQRGYSWQKPQLEDLWQDIEILEEDKAHYTGMLSVKFNAKEKIYYVIDGQQRITTLAILIKVIVDKFSNDDCLNGKEVSKYIENFLYKKTGSRGEILKMIFGYEVDNPSHIHFKTEILGLDNTDDSTPKDTLYTRNLTDAKTFFKEKVQKLDKKQLEKLLKKITENLKFNFYKIESELNEFVAFEVMNNRGKPLSTLELLKNRLIYLSTLLPNNDDEEKNELRCDINNAWKTIYEYLGRNPKNPLNDDLFLQNHCFIYFKFDKNINKKYKEFLLNKHFTAISIMFINRHKELLEHGFEQQKLDDETITYSDIKKYVADIQTSVKHYYFVHNIKDTQCPYTDKEKEIISKINRIGFQSFKPIVVVLCSRNEYKVSRIELFQYIEKYIFTRFNLEFFRSGTGSTDFYHLANKLQEIKLNIIENIVEVSLNLFRKTIYDFDKNDLWIAISKKFIDKVSDLDENFYNWKGLRYFLYEYEIFLQKTHGGELKVEWEHVNAETIEHIYPQTADDESWTNEFENQDLLHDLGNLLLLSKSTNSSLKNKPFEVKKEQFSTDSYSAIAVSKTNNWTPSEILARRQKMLEFMDERWSIEISNEVTKLLEKKDESE